VGQREHVFDMRWPFPWVHEESCEENRWR